MKKLIIAGFVACVALISQSAQVTWAVTRNSSSPIKGYTVYAISGDKIGEATSALQAQLQSYASYSALMDSYKLGNSVTAAANGAAAPTSAIDVGSATSLALIAFEDSSLAAGSSFLYTSAYDITENLFTPPDPAKEGLSLAYTAFSGSGTIYNGSSVPEPTSGLLLLLGVAGLALKRKQA